MTYNGGKADTQAGFGQTAIGARMGNGPRHSFGGIVNDQMSQSPTVQSPWEARTGSYVEDVSTRAAAGNEPASLGMAGTIGLPS